MIDRAIVHLTYAGNDLLAQHEDATVYVVEHVGRNIQVRNWPVYVFASLSEEEATTWATNQGYEVVPYDSVYVVNESGTGWSHSPGPGSTPVRCAASRRR